MGTPERPELFPSPLSAQWPLDAIEDIHGFGLQIIPAVSVSALKNNTKMIETDM